MFTVHVHIHVKSDCLDAFIEATAENARHSRKEPGIATFELLQADEDPTSFLLVETYRAAADQAKHKETDHFHRWVKTVESMMAEPRRAVKYTLPLPPA